MDAIYYYFLLHSLLPFLILAVSKRSADDNNDKPKKKPRKVAKQTKEKATIRAKDAANAKEEAKQRSAANAAKKAAAKANAEKNKKVEKKVKFISVEPKKLLLFLRDKVPVVHKEYVKPFSKAIKNNWKIKHSKRLPSSTDDEPMRYSERIRRINNQNAFRMVVYL